VGDRLKIKFTRLENGWADVLLSKGTKEYALIGVSYITDFVGDLTVAALDTLFHGRGSRRVWLDGEGFGWAMFVSHDLYKTGKLSLFCGKCSDAEEADSLKHPFLQGQFELADRKSFDKNKSFFVDLDPDEFASALADALEQFEADFSIDGIIPCDFIAQPNRPLAALRAALRQPLVRYENDEDDVVVFKLVSSQQQDEIG
jgi:hypothetical protein